MYIDSVPLIETTGRHARHFTQITGALVAALDPLLDLVSQQGHFVVTVPQEWSAEFGELIDQFTLQRWWKRPSRELTPTHAEEFAFIRTSVRELKRLWGMQAKGATCRIGHVLDHLSRSSVMLHGGVMSTPKDVSRAKDNPALLLFIGEFWTDLSPEMRSVLIKTTNLTPDEAERLVSETNERNRLAVIRLSGRVE